MTDSANPFILNLSTLYVMFFLKTPFNKIKRFVGFEFENSLQLIKSMYCSTAQISIYQETKQLVNYQLVKFVIILYSNFNQDNMDSLCLVLFCF